MKPRLTCSIVLSLIALFSGCAMYIGDDGYYAEAPAEVEALCNEFKTALADKDWEKVKALHWSGYEETQEELQKLFEPMLAKIGEVKDVQLEIYDEMDKNNYREYWEKDEIPGPVDLLVGEIEFYVDGPYGEEGPYIYLDAFLAKEEGELKIMGYYERSFESND